MFGFFKKKPAPPPEPEVLAPIPPRPAGGGEKFAVAMHRELSKAAPGNLFFSPYSIAAAMTMVQAGASGETREEIETVLGFPGAGDALVEAAGKRSRELASRSEPTKFEKNLLEDAPPDSFGCRLSPVNAIWHQSGYPVKPDFVETLRSRLGADVRPVDFARALDEAVKTVNAWVAKATNDRIRDVLSPGLLHPQTRVLLANAIYFKARWAEPFEERDTKPGPFRLLNGTTVDVPMMANGGFFPSSRDPEIHALRMDYSGGNIAMIVLLPEPGRFERVAASLDADRIEGLVEAMTSQQTVITFPKFRVECGFMLGNALRALGIRRAFGAGDFSRISDEPGFALSDVLHKTYVEVDEKGTEAAAVTIPMLAGSAPPKKIVEFRVDRPFLFLIRDLPTKTTLFLGKIVDPRR